MLHKDPTEFRDRFLRWKKGELVYENGLALPAYEDGKWNPNDTYTADAGMIKSKLAIASHFGNPTARRMTNYDGRDYTWPGEYEYINGVGEPKRGNVYVGSYDNLVTPQIQDNGKTLEFVDNPWTPENKQRSYRQSLKFNNMRDAWSFGENYKKYGPMMNRYEDGKLPGYKGGLIGMAPIMPFIGVDWSKAAKKVKNLYQYSKAYLKHKLEGHGEGEVIDLSDKKVARINSNTPNVTSILTNDFVESNDNVIRKKKNFINTTDTLLGDKKIPLSKISIFYGVENDRLKAGPLSIFDNETTVVPNRAKYVGKIKEYYPGKPASEEFKNAVAKDIEKYNKNHGYEPDWLSKILPFLPGNNPNSVLYRGLIEEEGGGIKGRLRARQRRSEIVNNIRSKHFDLGAESIPYLVTENNDTIKDYNLNASPKVLFADENGNSMFVANPRAHVEKINTRLRKTPMYPIMVDNGRYAAYQTTYPNAEIYGGFNRPDDMFLLGTVR